MLELLSVLLFIVYQYYYYYFSFFSSLNKRFPSIIKQAGLIFLYNCNYNNCYCNCECLVYIYSLVAFNVDTLKNDKKKLQIKKKRIPHAYLLKISVRDNKNLNPLLNLIINCIRARSESQILSIKVTCAFLFMNFLMIVLDLLYFAKYFAICSMIT